LPAGTIYCSLPFYCSLRAVSLLDAGGIPLNLEPASISDLISDTLESFSALARQYGVNIIGFAAAGVDPVTMDVQLVGRVLNNLVSNALRHTSAGGSVAINAMLVERGVSVSVTDTGEGISTEDLPHVFERFYRGEKSRNRASGGAGLGLVIAKGIVEAHGGSLAKNFPTSPWDVEVYGLVDRPQKYSVENIIQKFHPEERIYRMRCVEAWSMVIPWVGFPLSRLLEDVSPKSEAKYVRFESIFQPDNMPGQKQHLYPWPYQEGLRLDEAMNDLSILATGLYDGELPAQNGGGVRLLVPWKYGFKSIKAVVRIELVVEQPATMRSDIAPDEYGFYANVNPQVDHSRWSQRTERRISDFNRIDTLMFNGYGDQVAHLYDGMDLGVYI
jgi:sulfoxide reductase catalytic subunit YedY